MLALVAVVLVDGAVLVAPAGVGQVAPDGPLEEALAALAGDLAVVLARGLVSTHHADQILPGTAVTVPEHDRNVKNVIHCAVSHVSLLIVAYI